MQNPIERIKKYVDENPEKVNVVKNVATAITVQIVIGVAAHYATKAIVGTIDNYFEAETGIDEIPTA